MIDQPYFLFWQFLLLLVLNFAKVLHLFGLKIYLADAADLISFIGRWVKSHGRVCSYLIAMQDRA